MKQASVHNHEQLVNVKFELTDIFEMSLFCYYIFWFMPQ